MVDFSRLNFWTISDRYNHHQIVKNRYLHVDKLFWTKGLAIGDGSFFFPPFVCFSYSFEGSLRFFCVSSNKLHNTSEISEGCRMGEKLLQNPPPRLLYLLPTYLLRWKWKIIFQIEYYSKSEKNVLLDYTCIFRNLGKKKICTYLCEPNDQVSCMFHYAVWINILTIFHVKKYTIQNSV